MVVDSNIVSALKNKLPILAEVEPAQAINMTELHPMFPQDEVWVLLMGCGVIIAIVLLFVTCLAWSLKLVLCSENFDNRKSQDNDRHKCVLIESQRNGYNRITRRVTTSHNLLLEYNYVGEP